MKQHRLYYHLISLLLALSIIGAVGCASFFAVEGEEENAGSSLNGNGNQYGNNGDNGNESNAAAPNEPDRANNPNDNGNQGNENQGNEYQGNEDDGYGGYPQQGPNQWYDPIYGYEEDVTSAYEEPEHLGELPAVSPTQVVEATSVAIPVVAVSDASLFSGIVMWLCVALGIAVVVGVLVSRRTRRG